MSANDDDDEKHHKTSQLANNMQSQENEVLNNMKESTAVKAADEATCLHIYS